MEKGLGISLMDGLGRGGVGWRGWRSYANGVEGSNMMGYVFLGRRMASLHGIAVIKEKRFEDLKRAVGDKDF